MLEEKKELEKELNDAKKENLEAKKEYTKAQKVRRVASDYSMLARRVGSMELC